MASPFLNPFAQIPFYPLQRIQTILQTQNSYLPPEKRFKNAFDLIKRLPEEEKEGWFESSYKGFFPHFFSGLLGHSNFFGPFFLFIGFVFPVGTSVVSFAITQGQQYQLASLKLQTDINSPENRKYSSPADCLQQIEEVDGWKGKYRGLGLSIPLIIMEAYTTSQIYMGLMAPFQWRIMKKYFGFTAITYPLDVIRKRYMIESGNKEKKYNGYVDCFSQIVQEEGWQSLFSGLEVKMFRDLLLYSLLPSGVELLIYGMKRIK